MKPYKTITFEDGSKKTFRTKTGYVMFKAGWEGKAPLQGDKSVTSEEAYRSSKFAKDVDRYLSKQSRKPPLNVKPKRPQTPYHSFTKEDLKEYLRKKGKIKYKTT